MMKIIDKIKNHGNEEKNASEAAAAAEKKRVKEQGPRMHPELLELYTVTDHVLGVGTFATVKEIVLKETGKSYALKIILKKTLQ
ncbi:hypothetical protein BGZ52_012396, partial [Haplosporangium bisporale]